MEIKLQPRQEAFLSSPADVAIIGGAAGGGKSYSLLLEPLRHINSNKFSAVTFRRSMPEISQAGGIWSEAQDLYPQFGAHMNEVYRMAKFPSGAEISFSHLQLEKTVYNWRSSQIALLQFDQLESFTESQFFYMLSRNRSRYNLKAYCRAAANPEPNWLSQFLFWWLDKDGYADPDKDGQIRWVVRLEDKIIWADTREQLLAEYRGSDPVSVAFFLSTLYDNKILMQRNPGYIARLKALPYVERMRLLGDDPARGGNWFVKPAAGLMFNQAWWRTQSVAPNDLRMVRYWDLAATEKSSKSKDPDWTAGVKMGADKDNRVGVLDVVHFRESAHNLERILKNTAALDGINVPIHIEQEGGAGAKLYLEYIRTKVLPGYAVYAHTVSQNKVERSKPFSSMVEAGNVYVLEREWTKDYIDELHNFPDATHDDMVDASSGAYNELFGPSESGGIYV